MAKRRMLEGLKVLDFTWAIVGPFTTKFLADHGATVVKVESMRRVDAMRTFQPYKDGKPGINRSGVFAAMNSGKYSMALNMRMPEAKKVAERLVSWCDVLVENFAPGAMDDWGMGYDSLKDIKDDLIMLSMSSMGQTGRYAHYHGLGFHLIGYAGFCEVTGFPDRDPFGSIAYTDFTGPPIGIAALMGALDHRRRTGEGMYIDMSQVEAGIPWLGPAVLDYTVNGRDTKRRGNDSPYAAPHGAYRCKGEDRWCVVAVFTDEHWRALGEAVGEPDWTQDERYATLSGRLAHRAELDAHMEGWTSQHAPEEVMDRLQAVGVPAGIVKDGKDLYEDPQFAHRGFYQRLEHAEMGEYVTRRSPVVYSDADASVQREAPILGQNTEFVCTQILGMPDEEWLGLMEQGVFQ